MGLHWPRLIAGLAVGRAWWAVVSLAMAVVPAGVTASTVNDVPFSVPQAESSRLAHLALTALLFPHADEDARLEGDTFILPVPLPWPPGADQARAWDLDVPGGAPIFALAALAPVHGGLVNAAVISVDGAALPPSEVLTTRGAYLPDLQGGQEYAALASVIPPLQPGRHTITVACSACVPAVLPGNAWLATVNAGSRTYRLNVQPPPAASSGWSALERAFASPALGREMPYRIYLPPGYGEPPADGQPVSRRYPVLYLLHGLGGSQKQWSAFGFVAELERQAAAAGTPFIVVMPSGRAGYWVNHADGGPRWGEYVAQDLVAHVDATYLTVARPEARAIGGVSMGGHGALQLSLNHPDVFEVVGAHSPALRTRDQAPPFLGGLLGGPAAGVGPEAYAARDPISLVRRAPAGQAPVRAFWLDIGQQDRWAPRALELRAALQQQGWQHRWQSEPGGHDLAYWQRWLPEYVRFYRAAFADAGF